MNASNITNAPLTTAAGGLGAIAIYLALAGAKVPTETGDYVVLGLSVLVFIIGMFAPHFGGSDSLTN